MEPASRAGPRLALLRCTNPGCFLLGLASCCSSTAASQVGTFTSETIRSAPRCWRNPRKILHPALKNWAHDTSCFATSVARVYAMFALFFLVALLLSLKSLWSKYLCAVPVCRLPGMTRAHARCRNTSSYVLASFTITSRAKPHPERRKIGERVSDAASMALLCGRLNFHNGVNLQLRHKLAASSRLNENEPQQQRPKEAQKHLEQNKRRSEKVMRGAGSAGLVVPTAARAWRPFSPKTLTCACVNTKHIKCAMAQSYNEIGAAIHDRSDGCVACCYVHESTKAHNALDALQISAESMLRLRAE